MSHHPNRPRFARAAARQAAALAVVSSILLGAISTTTGAATASQKAQAKKALLATSDFPTGWTTTKAQSGGTSTLPGAKQLAGCIGVPSESVNPRSTKVNSPDFHSPDMSQEVDDSVSIFSSAKQANASYAALSNTKTPTCMTRLLNGSLKKKLAKSMGNGTTLGTIGVTKFSAPGTAGFTIALPITTQGQTLTFYISLVSIKKGVLTQKLTLDSTTTPFPTALANQLVAAAQSRL